jgi:hypothetical protein
MLRRHTLARMKKRDKREKSKVDKKDDITIVLFSLLYFPDYIVWPSIIKKAGFWSIMEVPNIF